MVRGQFPKPRAQSATVPINQTELQPSHCISEGLPSPGFMALVGFQGCPLPLLASSDRPELAALLRAA